MLIDQSLLVFCLAVAGMFALSFLFGQLGKKYNEFTHRQLLSMQVLERFFLAVLLTLPTLYWVVKLMIDLNSNELPYLLVVDLVLACMVAALNRGMISNAVAKTRTAYLALLRYERDD